MCICGCKHQQLPDQLQALRPHDCDVCRHLRRFTTSLALNFGMESAMASCVGYRLLIVCAHGDIVLKPYCMAAAPSNVTNSGIRVNANEWALNRPSTAIAAEAQVSN